MYKLLPILLFTYGLAITTEDIYDNSYALIIGIDKYENVRSLDYAVKDAEDIQSMLMNKFNFQQDNIVLLKNKEATKASILQEFSNITKKAEANDRILIFFAGHGETEDLPDGGEMGYLLPVDGNNTDLYISSIKMDEIQTISLRSEAKHILYLIDACYGGIATVGARSLDAESTPNYLNKITQYKSRQIISAGGRGEQVIEKSEWGHSAFTKNLLSGLGDWMADTDSDGIITVQELGTYLKKKVTIDSNGKQTPKTRNLTSDEGEFIFFNNQFDNEISNQNIIKTNNDAKNSIIKNNGYFSRSIKVFTYEDFLMLGFRESLDEHWSFDIGYTKLNSDVMKKSDLVSIEESHSLSMNMIGIGLAYNYWYTEKINPQFGLAADYIKLYWEDYTNNNSGVKTIIGYIVYGRLTYYPYKIENPFPLMLGLSFSSAIGLLPSSYYIEPNGKLTLDDWKPVLFPGINIIITMPK